MLTPCRPVSAALELGLVQRVNVITTYTTPGAPRNSRSRIMRVKAVCMLHILIKLSGAIATSLQAETCVWLFPLAVLEGVKRLRQGNETRRLGGHFSGIVPRSVWAFGSIVSSAWQRRRWEGWQNQPGLQPQARSSHTLSTATFI